MKGHSERDQGSGGNWLAVGGGGWLAVGGGTLLVGRLNNNVAQGVGAARYAFFCACWGGDIAQG
jgi:hypothetical protein